LAVISCASRPHADPAGDGSRGRNDAVSGVEKLTVGDYDERRGRVRSRAATMKGRQAL